MTQQPFLTSINWQLLGYSLLTVMGLSLLGFFLIIGFAIRRLRTIEIPPHADFTDTLKLVPLSLVIAMDLLDLGLDIFAAPISWLILDRLGLKALRGMAAVEALLPFTQPIPTLTISWLLVNIFGVRF